VVTQGTDTIEESAFALGILVASPKPVVVTGAMRNPTLPGADGPANLLAAVQVASSPETQGLGCVVVLNDEIHANRFVRKMHTTSTSAFRSPLAGPIGWVHEGRPRVVARHSPHVHVDIASGTPIPPVALLKVSIGDDSRLLGEILGLGYAGLVVEGFGGGHVPEPLAPVLGELTARMPVVLASRTGSGEVLRETYGFEGSESDLLNRGLISAGLLDGLKSRVLLSLLLASGASRDAIAKSFAEMSD
jgi:L-asparaginase